MPNRSSKALAFAGAFFALAACTDTGPVAPAAEDALLAGEPSVQAAAGRPIPGSYIVVLREGANPRSVAAVAGIRPVHVYGAAAEAPEGSGELRAVADAEASAVVGFSAALNQGQLRALQNNPNVAYIEQDQVIETPATQRMDSYGDPWGLDRIDQRARPLSKSYTYNGSGSRVYAYVIDSGIQASHPEFGSRARSVFDVYKGNGADCNGHGTHVAGIIGGKTYGVAKSVRIRSLKVTDCKGTGSASGLLAAMDWVRRNHAKPAVVNLSILTGRSTVINDATTALVNAGVFVSVAAGNLKADACKYSPASASGVVTVAASTNTDYRASYSNYGKCVHTYAPGSSIRSAYLNSGASKMTGTSMAAPHVAGVAALYLHKYTTAKPSTVRSWILNNATTGVIRSNPSGTPNRLLFKSSL